MAIPNVTPYSGQKPTPGQDQPTFNQNMSDELDYFNELPAELNPAIDAMNQTAADVDDAKTAAQTAASEAENSAVKADLAADAAGYKGEWYADAPVELGDIWGYEGSEWRSLTGADVEPVEGLDWRSINDHSNLTNRDEQGAHPASAIALNDGGSVQARVDKTTINVENIPDLQSLDLENFNFVRVLSYHSAPEDSGGGLFIKAVGRHDGGLFIDPSRPFPSNWSDDSQLNVWFADSGADVIGFKKVITTPVSPCDFGAKQDGVTDILPSVRALEKATSGRIYLTASKNGYRVHPLQKLKRGIDGNNQKIFGGLLFDRTEDNFWKYTEHRDIQIYANGGAFGVSMSPTNEYAGRHIFSNVYVREAETGFLQPKGNIGNGYYRISTSKCKFGYRAYNNQSGEGNPMQMGAMRMEQAHFSECDVAGVYICDMDGTGATGGVSLHDVIVEDGKGFGIFIKCNPQVYPFNKMEIDGFWCENRLVGADPVEIDGVLYNPRVLRIEGCKDITVSRSYLYDFEIINSNVRLDNCRVDRSFDFPNLPIDVDDNSYVVASDLIVSANGTNVGSEVIVDSVKSIGVNSPTAYTSLRFNDPTHFLHSNENTVMAVSLDSPVTFTGQVNVTGAVVDANTLSGKANEFVIPSGKWTRSPDVPTLPQGMWVSFSCTALLVDGDVDILWQQTNTLGRVATKKGVWMTYRGYQYVKPDETNRTVGLWLQDKGEGSTVQLAHYHIQSHKSESEAVSATNSLGIYK